MEQPPFSSHEPEQDTAAARPAGSGWRLAWAALALTGLLAGLAVAARLGPSLGSPTTTVAATENLSAMGPAEGDAAPDFSVPLFDGDQFTLSEHLVTDGRPVLLNFWASWCVPCRREMPVLEQASRRHPEVLFLGVAVEDDPAAARAFAQEVGVSYPLGIDETGTMLARYPAFGLPTTWFISSDGQVAGHVVGELSEQRLEALLDRFGS